jgi:MYXO-CTERM domain-containing protein
MRGAAWLRTVGVGVLLATAPAEAQLTQPAAPLDVPQPLTVPRPVTQNEINDATGLVPEVPMAGMYTGLNTLFTYRNETIDYQMDAMTEPATFSPLCSFSGTLVLRGGGCEIAFGWYNAVAPGGPAPLPTEIYPLIPATDPDVYGGGPFTPLAIDSPPAGQPGAWVLKTFTAADIRNNPLYLGGEIGFALIGGGGCSQTKYSQRELNQTCTSCTPMEPFITTVIYEGTVEPNSFYMAFEDLPVSPTSFTANNDGDFNDFVFYITGIVCSGGGEPCDTGKQGACAIGKTDCSENGEPGQCREVVKPTTEKCDNVDNDCNGQVDDGDLCPIGKVCDHGSCVAACNTGEFKCPPDLDCDRGFCIDPLCVGVMCEMGKACRAGTCVGACDGVTCPLGQECQLGHCVDLCAGVECMEGQVCEGGLCLADCGCRTCGAGKTCAPDGRCVDSGCETQTCLVGQVCVAGTCQDACTSAVCPGKAACVQGVCAAPIEDPSMETPGTGGSDGIGGLTFGPMAGALSFAGSGAGKGGSGPGSMLSSGQSFPAPGCACRAVGTSGPASLAWLALGAFGLAQLRRRRRA